MTRQALILTLLAAAAVATVAIDNAIHQPPAAASVVRMSMLQPAVRIDDQLGFSWSDCGGPGAWVKVKSASMLPNPVDVDGNITVAFSVAVSHALGDAGAAPLAGSVKIEAKVYGSWVRMPCIENIGSCNYSSLCAMAPPPAKCPPEFQKAKVPCQCPVAVGNYTLPGYSFTVDASQLPDFLKNASYRVSVNVNSGENQVLCAKLQVKLGK